MIDIDAQDLTARYVALSAGGGEPLGGGLEFVELDVNGRITTDYMFPGA
ncbi:hypothetical protein [Sphaerisporangium perillae]|nr:hypothetical protein [Sphaerisporangium perillae]